VLRKKRRSFTREFKQSAVARMATAESIRGLAAELKVEQRLLYHWRDQFQTGDPDRSRPEEIGVRRRSSAVENALLSPCQPKPLTIGTAIAGCPASPAAAVTAARVRIDTDFRMKVAQSPRFPFTGRSFQTGDTGLLSHSLYQRTRTMNRRRLTLGLLLPTAIMVLVAWTPGRAEDIGANKSGLIRGLLATVVNISTRKDEGPSPAPAMASATVAGGTTPAADAGQNIKSYAGSGFVIDPSGLIVTNYHVVEDAFEITVMLSDGSLLPGKMLSASRLADLAIVKVEPDHPLAAAHWGNSDSLQVGDQVFAAGNPFGIGLSVSAGIVSALNRDIQDSPYDDYIQTDAAINHGNSGGPLFDMQGNVVGVNSTIYSPSSSSAGIGFAIPSSTAQFVFEQLRTYGWVHPGWIGVKIQKVTREIAASMGMPHPQGSIISWVLPDGPAKKAGLAIGDVILRYDGTAPTDDRALLRDIAHTPEGALITLTVLRNGSELSVPITAEAWPRDQWEERDAPTPVSQPKFPIPPNMGLSLSALDAETREKLQLGNDPGGVLVKNVAPWSDAANRGIRGGDVILRVQDKAVATPDDVLSGIDAARSNKRDFLLMLVLPKLRDIPGPKWIALRVGTAGD
jgi:serine protease Do